MCTGIYEIQMYCVEQTYIIKSREMGEINFNNIYLIHYTHISSCNQYRNYCNNLHFYIRSYIFIIFILNHKNLVCNFIAHFSMD